MFTKLFFLLSESLRTIYRAKLSAVISSITIAIFLVIFSLVYFVYTNLLSYSFQFKSHYEIEVFFENELSLQEGRELFNSILILEGIEQGDFIDKNRAAELFNSFFNENIQDIIGENPLPMGGKFDVSDDYRNAQSMNLILKNIRILEGVDLASFQHGIISRLDSIIENILGISILLGIIILIVAIILVSNTIRLIIHTKQESIKIMNLLGATNSFIRFPFILEGFFQGLLGAFISLFILYILSSLQEYLLEPVISLPFTSPHNLIIYNIVFGLILSLIGSIRGISKYMPK